MLRMIPRIFYKGKQFKKEIILVVIGYYCPFSLSYREASEILKERVISVQLITIMFGRMNE